MDGAKILKNDYNVRKEKTEKSSLPTRTLRPN